MYWYVIPEEEGLVVTRRLTVSSAYQSWQSIMVSHRAVDQLNSWDSSINMRTWPTIQDYHYTTKATKWFGIASKVHGLEVNQNWFRSYFGSFLKNLAYDQFFELKNFRSNFWINVEELLDHELLKQVWSNWWLLWCMKRERNYRKELFLCQNLFLILYYTGWTWTFGSTAKGQKGFTAQKKGGMKVYFQS